MKNPGDRTMTTDPPARRLRGVIVINALLLAILAGVTFGAGAHAQLRQRGTYTMAAGGANGSDAGVVYIVDATNQEMIAVTYDPNTKQMVGVGYRNLAHDKRTVTR